MELFHGSHKDIKILRPSDEMGYLYASPSFNYAMCFAGKKWQNGKEINLHLYKNNIYLEELKENAFKDIYNTKGYIYIINDDSFNYFIDDEYISPKCIKPIERIKIKNVYNYLKKSEIILCSYSGYQSL